MSFLYSGSLWSSLYCGVSSLCVGTQVACQGFLVREACVDVLVDGAVFLLSVLWFITSLGGELVSSDSSDECARKS